MSGSKTNKSLEESLLSSSSDEDLAVLLKQAKRINNNRLGLLQQSPSEFDSGFAQPQGQWQAAA